jgi:deazaflavin-dependent oxidoreductase (nitroreductase family)
MPSKKVRRPPKWFARTAWYIHRGLFRVTRGKIGLWRPKPGRWGALRLTAIGRRSGKERSVILGYFEAAPAMVTMAMNGWADGEPLWWLNLQAQPEARVEIKGDAFPVRCRAAEGEERTRLWARWQEIDRNLDAYAALRSTETAVVVLEPITTSD